MATGKDRLIVSAVIVVIVALTVLLVSATAPPPSSVQGLPGEPCIYLVNRSTTTLLNSGSCSSTLGKVELVSLEHVESGNITGLLQRGPVIIFDPDSLTVQRVSRALLGVDVHLVNRPGPIMLYRMHGHEYMVLLNTSSLGYAAVYISLALRSSYIYDGNAILVPGSVAGRPVLIGLSLMEEKYSQPVNIVPLGESYNESLGIVLTSVICGCVNSTGSIEITVKAERGGILVGYEPSTSNAPLWLKVSNTRVLKANFTGLYLDKSDFSRNTASWAIEVYPCWSRRIEVAPAYALVGVLSNRFEVMVTIGMESGNTTLIIG